MSYLAIVLIILSAVLHAIWNFLGKRGKDILVFFWWSLAFQLLVFFPLFVYLLHYSTVNFDGWYIVLASGILVSFYWVLLSSSYKYGDLSLVYPIVRSTPIIVAVLAVIFYGEKLSPLGVIGILAVIVGVYIIPMRSLDIRNLIKPFAHLKNKAIMFAGLTTMTLSVHHIIDKAGTRFFNALVYVWLINFVAFAILTVYIAFSKRRRFIRQEWSLNRLPAAITGILVMLSYSLIVFVMKFEKISYIMSMRQLSIVFGVILGNLVLRERYGLVRFIASGLIFLGIFCIGIAD